MDTLRQIIREELSQVLKEQALNWWHKPAEAELDAHIYPHQVHEEKEKRKRARIGKSDRTGTWTSAGTVPYEQGREMSDEQIKNRKEIGKKMLNVLRRGGKVGNEFRKKLIAQLVKRKKPTNRQYQYSMVWANASSVALNGGTAASWTPYKEDKKKDQESQAEEQ